MFLAPCSLLPALRCTLQTARPDPPEFDPDPGLRLERALCYTGGLPGTLEFVGKAAEYVAFPCNNVIVMMETPVMPKVLLPEGGGRREESSEENEEEGGESSTPAPHVFLRGHTDVVTRVRLSHAGHLLASAQGDSLGAAGKRLGVKGRDARVGRRRGEGGI